MKRTRRRAAATTALTPEALAHAAVAKAVHEAGPDGKVRLDVRVSLTTADAERLSALAIRHSQNLGALVSEILERHLRKGVPRDARPARSAPTPGRA